MISPLVICFPFAAFIVKQAFGTKDPQAKYDALLFKPVLPAPAGNCLQLFSVLCENIQGLSKLIKDAIWSRKCWIVRSAFLLPICLKKKEEENLEMATFWQTSLEWIWRDWPFKKYLGYTYVQMFKLSSILEGLHVARPLQQTHMASNGDIPIQANLTKALWRHS